MKGTGKVKLKKKKIVCSIMKNSNEIREKAYLNETWGKRKIVRHKENASCHTFLSELQFQKSFFFILFYYIFFFFGKKC